MDSQIIKEMDATDKLADKIKEFDLAEGCIYLNGNSLGPLSRSSSTRVQQIVQKQWGEDLIASWNKHGWIDLPVTVGEKIARLIGAASGQVICCDSISVNLFKLLSVCLSLRSDRFVVLSQADNFPTDLYVAQGLEQLLGSGQCRLQLVDESEIETALDQDVAVLMLSHVNFRSGRIHGMQSLTRKAHDNGALVIWDLAHSTGVLPLELDAWDVDFAVGCGYKFLNGGPGAPAFIYANRKHHDKFTQPLQGWMGHATPFDFDSHYEAAKGVSQFLAGTPPILSLGSLDAALDIFFDIDVADLREKSNALSELFLELVEEDKDLAELQLQSPRQVPARGAQLSFSHPEAYAISRALNAHDVIGDFRSPDILRFGFSPLYLRFTQIQQAVSALSKIVREEIFSQPQFQVRNKVT